LSFPVTVFGIRYCRQNDGNALLLNVYQNFTGSYQTKLLY